MSRIDFPRPAGAVATVFNISAGLLLMVLMVLTVGDVVGRNFFGQSILGTVDISTLLLVAVAFLGLASAEIEGRHVAVSLVEGRLSARTRTALSGLRAVLLLVVGLMLVWGLGEVLISAYERAETTNDILRLPTWPAKLVLFASFLLFFVMAVWKEIREFAVFRAGGTPETSEVDAALEQAYAATSQPESEADTAPGQSRAATSRQESEGVS